MRGYALHCLTALAAGLAAVLLALWLNVDGSVRNTRWTPPEPQTTDYRGMLPALPGVGQADTGRFIAMLDRPVFSSTRRPPPPPPPPQPAVAPPPPDNLSTARLSGVFQGDGAGGVIMLIAGKQRRVQLNDSIEGWVLKSISGRSVTFAKGADQRVLTLERALVKDAPNNVALPPARASASGGARLGGGTTAVPAPATPAAAAAPAPARPRPTFGGS